MSRLPHRRFPRTMLAAAVVALATLAAPRAEAQEHPRVVASILPVHSLVAGVMSGVGEPHLLVPRGENPADYTPSADELSLLADANVLFMTDDSFAADLDNRIGTADTRLNVVALKAGPGVDGQGASWLDPENAKTWVRAIAATLTELDQDNRHAYSANAEGMLARLDALETEIETMMRTNSGTGVLVFDPMLRPFAQRFELDQASTRPEMETPPQTAANPVGAGDEVGAAEIRGRVRDAGQICRVTPDDGGSTQAQPGEQVAQIDVLGRDAQGEPSRRYEETLRGVAEDVRACLED